MASSLWLNELDLIKLFLAIIWIETKIVEICVSWEKTFFIESSSDLCIENCYKWCDEEWVGLGVRISSADLTNGFGVLKLHIIEKVYFDYGICYIYDLKRIYQCSIQTNQKLKKGKGSEWWPNNYVERIMIKEKCSW